MIRREDAQPEFVAPSDVGRNGGGEFQMVGGVFIFSTRGDDLWKAFWKSRQSSRKCGSGEGKPAKEKKFPAKARNVCALAFGETSDCHLLPH